MAFNKAKALLEAQKHVSEGKLSQAIKQYLQIVDKDPTDLILLNTVGDLYIREKKFSDGMKQFYRLADAYMKDGFIVKAIAMYRKISKLEPNSVEPMLKLAELYVTQGLNRESREQFSSALDLLQRKKDTSRALEVVRKMARLDPNNPHGRLRLAEFAERAGKKQEAASAYLEAATIADRVGDAATAEKALSKAAEFQPEDPQVQLLLARQAHRKKDFAEAEKIISSSPQLSENAAARRLLFDSYIALGKPEAAQKLLLQVFHANPADFSPVAGFAAQCLAKQNVEGAFSAVSGVAEELMAQRNTEGLMETLRKIWAQAPGHTGTLELIYSVAERTADESTIPEVLEALGRAYTERGELEKAEAVYQRLVKREPENEDYKGLLKQILQKQGKEYVPADAGQLSASNAALEMPAGEVAAETPEEAAMVKEAIENSDLFVRYNLVEKAVAELEKVLEIYPNQITIHKTLVEICRKNLPVRSAQAAESLARIYSDLGDEASARYNREIGGRHAEPVSVTKPEAPAAPDAPPPTPSGPSPAEFDLSQEFALSEPQEAASAEPVEIPVDLGAPSPAEEPAPAAASAEAMVSPAKYEETAVEIKFYLDQGLKQEARKAVDNLEAEYPGDSAVARLRELLESPSRTEGGDGQAAETVASEAAAANEDQVLEPADASAAEPSETPPAEAEAPASPDALGDLAEGLAEGLDSLGASAAEKGEKGTAAPEAGGGADLSGLLDELGEPGSTEAAGDDPETHYNLGVAFREMGLLDEAIGEFQRVAMGTGKNKFPPNFLQACTLLAVCFNEKNMPEIAVRWYLRAMETPNLDAEAMLALHYDLGVAYEEAGDTKRALEKFTEVYSQNIDYRDVSEKIRLLQHKAP
jgi:tetratricopeptide (TPR) repeat protein